MDVAIGLKAHSGWAALVVLGEQNGAPVVVDRRRLELVAEEWAKQPYHAAEKLEIVRARDVVKRGVDSARRIAVRELRAIAKRELGHAIRACAVLVVDPMPAWSVDEILAVHFRMHKAEGVLFRDALARAARTCRWPLAEIHEKTLADEAEKLLGSGAAKNVAALGKTVRPPWGRDQKEAALAALIALRSGER